MRVDRIQSADVRNCSFDCGVPELNDYFMRFAVGNDRINVGRTYVLRNVDDSTLPPLIGFATLSMGSIECNDLDEAFRQKLRLPKYPMPVAMLGRFAIDARAKRRGFGELLLSEMFSVILNVAETIACLGILVDAKNDDGISFYGEYGFNELPGQGGQYPRRMFIALKAIIEARSAND